jgi:hypothetical protein
MGHLSSPPHLNISLSNQLHFHREPSSSSFLGSTAQFKPWPPPQNPAEFLGGFSTFSFLQGRVVSPTPIPRPGEPGLCILYPPEAGWLPILVASYDTHVLRWEYSNSPVTYWRLFPRGQRGRNVKLIIHFHVMSRLGIRGT